MGRAARASSSSRFPSTWSTSRQMSLSQLDDGADENRWLCWCSFAFCSPLPVLKTRIMSISYQQFAFLFPFFDFSPFFVLIVQSSIFLISDDFRFFFFFLFFFSLILSLQVNSVLWNVKDYLSLLNFCSVCQSVALVASAICSSSSIDQWFPNVLMSHILKKSLINVLTSYKSNITFKKKFFLQYCIWTNWS